MRQRADICHKPAWTILPVPTDDCLVHRCAACRSAACPPRYALLLTLPRSLSRAFSRFLSCSLWLSVRLQGIATVAALDAIRGERSLVISRSTFAGSGAHHGHWLGDNDATWNDLYYSLPGVLSMNMLGQPLVGADVCGFGSTPTTPELCTRWMALGAWTYGFYRNHKTIGAPEQAPSVFNEPYRSYMRELMRLYPQCTGPRAPVFAIAAAQTTTLIAFCALASS